MSAKLEPYVAPGWQGRSGVKCYRCGSDTWYLANNYTIECLHTKCRALTHLAYPGFRKDLFEVESWMSKEPITLGLIRMFRTEANKRGARVLAMRFTKEAWSEMIKAWPIELLNERCVLLGIAMLNDGKENAEGRKFGVEYASE